MIFDRHNIRLHERTARGKRPVRRNIPGPVMEYKGHTKSAASPFQHRLSLFLLALLAIIVGAILWIQRQYDPAAWRGQGDAPSSQAEVNAELPMGIATLSPPEQYNAQTLSDKINGKADLYLSAGFKSLESQRFGLVSDKSRWMEHYLYDMGGHENAFAVYSMQRRKDTKDTDLTSRSYLSANGLFLVHGAFYLEIIAAETTPEMQAQMKALASTFVDTHPAGSHNLPILELFASQDKVPHTTKLIADSAFGIQGMDWIYTTVYATENTKATAFTFIKKCGSGSEARALADKTIAYWNEYGGEAVDTPAGFTGAQIVFILDNYEISAVLEDYLYGVHEVTDLDFGLSLISRMQRIIGEAVK